MAGGKRGLWGTVFGGSEVGEVLANSLIQVPYWCTPSFSTATPPKVPSKRRYKRRFSRALACLSLVEGVRQWLGWGGLGPGGRREAFCRYAHRRALHAATPISMLVSPCAILPPPFSYPPSLVRHSWCSLPTSGQRREQVRWMAWHACGTNTTLMNDEWAGTFLVLSFWRVFTPCPFPL